MSASSADDSARLIQQIARGDRQAFGRFYDRYASLVFTFAMRILRERSAAEDLLQEVFLQAWREAGNYSKDRGSPEAWMITITRSRGIDKLRSIRRREKSFVEMEDPAGAAYDGPAGNPEAASDAKLTVSGALAELPESQRRVLEMAYFDGLTQSEIAAKLQEPLGTIKTRMRSAIGRLRELLGVKLGGESL